jgi:4-hydroxy-tetrahydrodipicolinate reductase
MNQKPKVVVSGALGRMGSAAIKALLEDKERFTLIAGIVHGLNKVNRETLRNYQDQGIVISDNLLEFIHEHQPDILVELTTPDSVFENSKIALENGVRPVIGATGLSDEDINELSKISQKTQTGAIIAPNFAIGAILMMEFSRKAAEYFDKYEIIEMHHDKKLDAPSGTAIKTAKLIENLAKNYPQKAQTVPIHSVRLPGLVAHQEVIFGGLGQTLTIRHDTIDRSSFMPGILLACEKVMRLNHLVYGLENILFEKK